MTEWEIAHDGDSLGAEEIDEERVQLGLAATILELPDQHTSDFFQSTGQP
jgi:hypothetical protein